MALKKLTITFLLLVAASTANAAVLSGRAFDAETRNLIRDVNIRIVDADKVVATDRKGAYEIGNLPAGTYRVVATHVNYDVSDTIVVDLQTDQKLDFKLHPKPWVLNEVVVTGTRSPHLLKDVPVQTEVVTTRDFQRTGAKTVDEALNSSIGITINDDLSGRGATIRGIEGDRVLILVDGERAVGRVRGSIDLGQFSLTNVEKIEIVKGTGSTLYGSDAMGGVINIITKKPTRSGGKLNIYGDYGSFESYNPSFDLDYGNPKAGITVGGRLYSTAGFDLDESTPHTNGAESTDRLNFDLKGRYQLSKKWSILPSIRLMNETKKWIESEEIPPDQVFIFNDKEVNNRYEGALVFDYLSGDKYSMKLRLFGTYYTHEWDKKRSTTGYLDSESNTEDVFYEISYSSNYVIGSNHTLTYGFDYNYQYLDTNTAIPSSADDNPDGDNSTAGYLQYEYSPIRSLNLLPGFRFEHHSSFGDHANPSLNIMYEISPDVKLRGFVGYGFRAPSIKQQYFLFDHASAGYVVYGSEVPFPYQSSADLGSLSEETSINSSMTMEFSYGTIGLHRLTFFYNHLEDLIDFELIGFYGNYWRGVYVYQNIGTAITRGLEWESRIRLHENIDMSFSYNYLATKNLDTGEELVNQPEHTLKFFITALQKRTGLGMTFWGNVQSKKLWVPRTNTGGNEGDPEYAPSRTTLNVNLFKRFEGGLETFVRFENLLDEINLDYGYWPGFQVFGGIKYDLSI